MRDWSISRRRFYTIEQIADNRQVSTRTVRRWIEQGRLTAHHFGRQVRVSAEDLKAFDDDNRDG